MASSSSSKSVTKITTTKVREKKVYSLPGQKHDPPEQVLNPYHWCLEVRKLISIYSNQLSLILVVFYGCCWQKEPLRFFYESLSKQIPASEMAEFWWVSISILQLFTIHFHSYIFSVKPVTINSIIWCKSIYSVQIFILCSSLFWNFPSHLPWIFQSTLVPCSRYQLCCGYSK